MAFILKKTEFMHTFHLLHPRRRSTILNQFYFFQLLISWESSTVSIHFGNQGECSSTTKVTWSSDKTLIPLLLFPRHLQLLPWILRLQLNELVKSVSIIIVYLLMLQLWQGEELQFSPNFMALYGCLESLHKVCSPRKFSKMFQNFL